jgi:hypothetical protein
MPQVSSDTITTKNKRFYSNSYLLTKSFQMNLVNLNILIYAFNYSIHTNAKQYDFLPTINYAKRCFPKKF